MDDLMREMLDHYQITKLLNVYCHGCDRLDQRRMASVYSEESWDDHGVYRDTGQRSVERISANMLATAHWVNLDPDEISSDHCIDECRSALIL
jgi:hypothetical protein